MTETILERWHLTADELTKIVDLNPSLRGIMIGYVAEFQVQKILLDEPRISNIHKFDDHDRSKGKKNDVCFTYKEHDFTIEVKSLQTDKVRKVEGGYTGTFQCDASDNRPITLPNGDTIKTTCLEIGGFDIVAVNLFAFRNQWEFGFALNRDLPRSPYKGYTIEQRQYLLASSMKISLPLQPPFVSDPTLLLDRLVEELEAGESQGLKIALPVQSDVGFQQGSFFDPI